MAPTVFADLEQNNITFAITTHGLKKTSDFLKNIRRAIEYGMSEKTALKALTETPATLLGVKGMVGSLKSGFLANFVITSGNIFDANTIIYENWIQGEKFVIHDLDQENYNGVYQLKIEDKVWKLQISGKPDKSVFKIILNDTTEIKADGSIEKNVIALNFKEHKDKEGKVRLSGWIKNKTFTGTGFLPDGEKINWSASFQSKSDDKKEKEKDNVTTETGSKIYPFIAYGFLEKPQQAKYLVKNATVWTNENEGIIENYDVLVENGKIIQVAKNISEKGAIIIDATGKHLTSGVIDEHSHIASSGETNEFSHAITPEVRIADVIDPDDINIYRQLAGGVTAAQILHGSANPVGGQSAIIKLRWGVASDELILNDGAQFLKHALGENVKQSRLPEMFANRFPVSRMGVETIIRDAYQQAVDYKKEWEAYEKLSVKEKNKTIMPRIDLRMEALVDVLEEKSFITCHAYVQSETNMILKLAEDFGIKAHTLIHNTEGYKIADKIAAHGAYASNLPDWWAYKYEVYQAIPYNSAIQAQQGVTVAIHSDNAELARRLNQEAAKTIKYGGLSQEEAWKMVTLNPAKILHLDHRMGSIKPGKDADLVIWSDNPLSMYAVVEKTMVDGFIYYDKEKDQELRQWIKSERNRIINKMAEQK
ncbi:MAG: amidohydrolase family protein [Bacteroidales bacterium]